MKDMPDSFARAVILPDLDPDIRSLSETHWWPLRRIGEGLEELSRRSGLRRRSAAEPLVAPGLDGAVSELSDWLDWAAGQIGLEAEAIDTPTPDVAGLLRRAGPAIILHENDNGPGFFLLLETAHGPLRLIDPDLQVRACDPEVLRARLCWSQEAPLTPEIDRMILAADVPTQRRSAVRAAMLRERLAATRLGGFWMLRAPAASGFARQLIDAGVARSLAVVVGVLLIAYGLEVASWRLIGGGALGGRLDLGLMVAWLLLIATLPPLHLVGGWFQANFALDAGRILKTRLLAGALRMPLDGVARQGVGHLLGRVMESQALESLSFNGGMQLLASALELGFAVWILSKGVAGPLHLLQLMIWLGLTAALGWIYYRRLRAWSLERLEMTHELVEGMVGHRTRLAQESAGERDGREDAALQRYMQTSRSLDQTSTSVFVGLPSGWLLFGLAGLAPALATGGLDPAAIAVSLGGLLVAQRALGGLAGGLGGVAQAMVAWTQVKDLFNAGRAEDPTRPFLSHAQMRRSGPRTPLLDGQGLTFGHRADKPVLRGADLSISAGDRILIEGASGSGKSTLAGVVTGLLTPSSGLLLMNGLDRHMLGDDWRRLAAFAPQFHDNHILSGPLAFNLLMGRQWPASEADLADAQAVCEDLGLGDLIARMPAGLMQRVGETGWQLSHGERSRIFLARALLQEAELVILDESYAALDPKTLGACLEATWRRAPTLVVIAHP